MEVQSKGRKYILKREIYRQGNMHLEEVLQHHRFDLSKISIPTHQPLGSERLVYLLHVPVGEALTQWERLRQIVPEMQYWPVFGWERFKDPSWHYDVIQDFIDEGLHLNIQQ